MTTRQTTTVPDFRRVLESAPGLYLVLSIIAVSEAYPNATVTRREDIMGRGICDVFPDNPDDPEATGERNLWASLEPVRRPLAVDTMAVQKYDIQRPKSEGGGFEGRFWIPMNSPVLGPDGRLADIIHRVDGRGSPRRRAPVVRAPEGRRGLAATEPVPPGAVVPAALPAGASAAAANRKPVADRGGSAAAANGKPAARHFAIAAHPPWVHHAGGWSHPSDGLHVRGSRRRRAVAVAGAHWRTALGGTS